MFRSNKKEEPVSRPDEMMISLKEEEREQSDYEKNMSTYEKLVRPGAVEIERPQYISVDGTYIACLECVHLPYKVPAAFLDEIINAGAGIEVFMNAEFVSNKTEVIKDITHYLGFTKNNLAAGDNQADSGTHENAYISSMEMKRGLANNDDFWYLSTLVKVSADNLEELENRLRKAEGILAGRDILAKRSNFHQLEAFLSTLPVDQFDERIRAKTRRNILSSGICATYPFISSALSDEQGMFMGLNKHDGSQIMIDPFNTKNYNNANIVVLGTSGAGKTFTTQMIASRFRMMKVPVMMICPLKGHEYRRLCDNVGGNYMHFAPGSRIAVNIFDIRETKCLERKDESMLAAKLQKLQIAYSLMFPGITDKQKKLLESATIEVYAAKGITMDNVSLYLSGESENGYISLIPKIKRMPILEDLYNQVKDDKDLADISIKMRTFVSGSMSFFNAETNIDLGSDYIVADISDMPDDLMSLAMFIILDLFWDKIKGDITQRTALILDELWKLMGAGGNKLTAEFVLEIFKIIRGYGGCAIGTTQDIEDYLALEDGKYGRGIINNANTKIVLKLEPFEAKAVKGVLDLSEEEELRVTKFKRGEAFLFAGSNHVEVKFMALPIEKMLIETDPNELRKQKEAGIYVQ